MATTFQAPLQLLSLGLLLLASPVHLQRPPPCEIIRNTVSRGSYNLDVSPPYYKPGAIYTVTVTGIENATSLILQAVSSEEGPNGLWESENQPIACSDTESLVQKNVSGSGARTRWTSPSNGNGESAEIRAFVSFANGTTLLQTRSLVQGMTTTVVATPSTASEPTSGSHRPTPLNNTTDSHMLHNATVVHPNLASSHQWTKGPPHSGVSVAHASSFLLALLPISLGYKLLS
ncbi:hypothetical protein JD844_031564 [Phrynosoma platyrhinos]|uniref:Placenta-expressed transcript 1 protein n=1 Tax=Phrynosoma platyrhinos TaxID=52577 RepID=A0ABQ7T1G7_PHRPL|nr:hypothetical protein JD844_031564 [Phrynosoma platyrhinos]